MIRPDGSFWNWPSGGWRNPAPREAGPEEQFAGLSLAGLFGRLWSLLPRELATPVLRELIDWALDMKSEPREYTLTEKPDDPKLASEQEFQLFILIPALQHLEPDLARSVLEGRPQLAEAVEAVSAGDAVRVGRAEQIRSRPRRPCRDRRFGADADRRSSGDRFRSGVSPRS